MVILPAGAFVYVFLFKMMSFMQSRLGPMEAGPYGSIQLLAEVGKFLQKEDIVPERADRRLFFLAPYIVLSSTFLLLVVMPFGPDAVLHQPRHRDLPRHGPVVRLGDRHPHRRVGVGQQVLPASAACAPPASSSPTSCRWCSPSSAW